MIFRRYYGRSAMKEVVGTMQEKGEKGPDDSGQ
jgi:hypothetical protein